MMTQKVMRENVNCPATGQQVRSLSLQSIQGESVLIPDKKRLTHLQFRRFAGCPTCNLHIRSFLQRYGELVTRRIQEVVVFHSSERILKEHFCDAPFAVVADPGRSLFKEFGVERAARSIIHPTAWIAILKGILQHGAKLPERAESVLNLPADFLIGCDGQLLKAKRGMHAYDQWSFDEVIELCDLARYPKQ
jgi:peroxiredoxin